MSELLFEATPDRLVDEGQLQLGIFRTPISEVNLDQARVPGSTAMGSRFKLKEWQHWMVVSPELMLTMAIVDIGYLKLSWIQAVELDTGIRHEWSGQSPLVRCQLSRSLWDDRCHFLQRGQKLRFHNQLSEGRHQLQIQGAPTKALPEISGELEVLHDLSAIDPLVVCMPVGEQRAMYSHKVPLPVQGEIHLGHRTYRLSVSDSIAFSDIHKAHYPRHTWWDWACFAYHAEDGRMIGLNLTHGMAQDPDRFTENAVWLDGRPQRLGPARFERNRGDLMQPWRVTTECGRAELRFIPQGGRSEDLDAGLISSNFQQLYGRWSGTLRHGKETLSFEGVMGLGEDHECHW